MSASLRREQPQVLPMAAGTREEADRLCFAGQCHPGGASSGRDGWEPCAEVIRPRGGEIQERGEIEPGVLSFA